MSGGDQPPAPPWVNAAQAGSALVAPVLLGVILDWQFDWKPWATLIGIAVGLIGSVSILIQAAKRSG
jgi:F0F1-type ATP synthase assembly protein I